MRRKYIISLDQGTTSTRAIVFDASGVCLAQSARKHEQIYPQPGFVSHNPKEIFFNSVEVIKKAVWDAGIQFDEVAVLGITNQRETIVFWDKVTGEPACDAIVWQCRRSADICKQIILDGYEEEVRQRTGLLPDPYFSASKIKWTFENVPEVRRLHDQNRLLVGTIDSYLVWKLTKGKNHVTDYTNASRTMLFHIHDMKWDEKLLQYFGIPREILPDLVSSSGICGYVDREFFGEVIPIGGVAGDQHAALFGQACFQIGDIKNTYGTGCFILANTGSVAASPQRGLLTTLAWSINGETVYALEGSIFSAGASIEWLMNELKLISGIGEIEFILSSTPDSNGVYFVPAFSGLSAPHWDMFARGSIFGMSFSTQKEHIVRAVCDSIAYQSADIINYMKDSADMDIAKIKVDGGVTRNNHIMQFTSDVLRIPVERSAFSETTALGAAYLAGMAVGFYDMEQVKKLNPPDRVFVPELDQDTVIEKYKNWMKAVDRSKNWLL
ncbi:sugar kinase [Holotrichia oblita]|nr:sugar kinase [Holotrichia oblita]